MTTTKFEMIRTRLKKHWGYDLTRNEKNDTPRWNGCWNTGFTVDAHRGLFWWFKTLKEIEEGILTDEDGNPVDERRT